MTTILIDSKAAGAAEETARLLSEGLTGVLPCDTIYGFSSLADSRGAESIYTIKQRPKNKNLIMLMTRKQAEESDLEIPAEIIALWPAPLTVIVRTPSGTTQAVRVPSDDFALSVISKCGPVWSTSVNISGEPSLVHFDEILARFNGECGFMVRKEEESSSALPSTIIDCTVTPWRLIRQGAYDVSHLMRLASM